MHLHHRSEGQTIFFNCLSKCNFVILKFDVRAKHIIALYGTPEFGINFVSYIFLLN
jgi:hypothetical protein